MALQLAVDQVNFRTIDPGDAIVVSTNRAAALQETHNRILNALTDYNRENPSVPLEVPTSSYDDDAGTAAQTAVFPFYIDATGIEKVQTALYLPDAAGWVVPTTGEFAGVENVFECFMKQVRYWLRINDSIRTNVLVNSANGLVTLETNNTDSTYTISMGLPFDPTLSATGQVVKQIFDVAAILDLQRGNPL
jgi:hypothetical protein